MLLHWDPEHSHEILTPTLLPGEEFQGRADVAVVDGASNPEQARASVFVVPEWCRKLPTCLHKTTCSKVRDWDHRSLDQVVAMVSIFESSWELNHWILVCSDWVGAPKTNCLVTHSSAFEFDEHYSKSSQHYQIHLISTSIISQIDHLAWCMVDPLSLRFCAAETPGLPPVEPELLKVA